MEVLLKWVFLYFHKILFKVLITYPIGKQKYWYLRHKILNLEYNGHQFLAMGPLMQLINYPKQEQNT